MAYTVVVTPRASRDLKGLERSVLKRIDRVLLNLEHKPFIQQTKVVKSSKLAQFRVRVGAWRILYDVDEQHKEVVILRVGHRREIYR